MSENGWTRQVIRLAILAGLLVLTFSLHSASASHDPALTVNPTSGSLFDHFTISGGGYAPGSMLKVVYMDSGGASYNLVDSFGNIKWIVVRSDGTFDLQLQPSNDLSAKVPGAWKVQVCVDVSPCWSTDLQITAASNLPGYGGGGEGGMSGDGGGAGGAGSGGY